MIALTPDEVLQIVPTMPRVRRPPSFWCRDVEHLILYQREGLVGRDASQRAGNRVEQSVHRNEADDRDEKQQRAAQREEVGMRQLRGETEAVIGHYFAGRAREQLAPRNRHAEGAEHQRTPG